MPLELLPFGEKSAFERCSREIKSKRPCMPSIVCPVLGNVDRESFEEKCFTTLIDKKLINDGTHYKVATLDSDDVFNDLEFEVDADIDDEERCQEVEREMGDSKMNAIYCGLFPLSWVIPDEHYNPVRPILHLFAGSTYHNFFKHWGPLKEAEMVFHEGRRISLLIRFRDRGVMAQAALSLHGQRYLKHQEQYFPINLKICNYDQQRKKCLQEQNTFEELTRGLSTKQKKAFTELMETLDETMKRNEALKSQLGQLQERKLQREKQQADREQAALDGAPLNEEDTQPKKNALLGEHVAIARIAPQMLVPGGGSGVVGSLMGVGLGASTGGIVYPNVGISGGGPGISPLRRPEDGDPNSADSAAKRQRIGQMDSEI